MHIVVHCENMYNVQLSSQILFSFGAAVEWFIIAGRIQSVCHYCIQLSFNLIHFVGWGVECRICKWKLLFVDSTFVAAFAKLTSFRDVGSSFSYIAPTD